MQNLLTWLSIQIFYVFLIVNQIKNLNALIQLLKIHGGKLMNIYILKKSNDYYLYRN